MRPLAPNPYICHGYEGAERERAIVPFSFVPNRTAMANEALIAQLTEMANAALAESPALFLVTIRIKPTNNVKVFLDGDAGVTVQDTIDLNRKLYPAIEAAALFPDGDFSLEVSSAGIGEPLLLVRQYRKNVGRHLSVATIDGVILLGILREAGDTEMLLEVSTGKGKKAVTNMHTIPYTAVKKAVVEVVF